MYEFNREAIEELKKKFPKTKENTGFGVWYDYGALKVDVAFLYDHNPNSDDAKIKAIFKIHGSPRTYHYEDEIETAKRDIDELYEKESAEYFKNTLQSTIENAILLFMKGIYEAPECNKIKLVEGEGKLYLGYKNHG